MKIPSNFNPDPLNQENNNSVIDIQSRLEQEEHAYFLRDALILIDRFFRTISGIQEIQSFLYIIQDEVLLLYTLKDRNLITVHPTPIVNYLLNNIIQSKEAILFNDLSSRPADIGSKPSGSSWLASPLYSDGKLIGATILQGPKNGPYFAESDKQILTALTEPLSSLVKSILDLQATSKALDIRYREVEEIAKAQGELALLTDKLLETLDVDLVLQTSVAQLREIFDLAEVEIQLIAS
ncbi:MAG: hypothetical protein Kow0088_00180 [Anaerolineales bacterium]